MCPVIWKQLILKFSNPRASCKFDYSFFEYKIWTLRDSHPKLLELQQQMPLFLHLRWKKKHTQASLPPKPRPQKSTSAPACLRWRTAPKTIELKSARFASRPIRPHAPNAPACLRHNPLPKKKKREQAKKKGGRRNRRGRRVCLRSRLKPLKRWGPVAQSSP